MPLNARKSVLGLAAAGLLTATALSVTPIFTEAQLHAQTPVETRPVTELTDFADLVDQVMPAVISVEVKFAQVADNRDGGTMRPNMPGLPEQFRDFFNQFPQFRDRTPNMPNTPEFRGPRGGQAQGSGFIISADGYAVTNNHVVQNADEVTVKVDGEGVEYTAKVIGTDPKTDLALIKINADREFKFVKFSSEEPRVGQWVMAVGNPFGLGGTVTTGIISARGRDIGSGPYDDFLQLDASINRGNSGGPAFNLKGEVIGVNTAIFSPSGGSVGIGFAIPAPIATEVIAAIRDTGSVTRGWLGVQIQPVTAEIAETMGLEVGKGALVSDVTEDSPALKAGFKTGDTILKLNGQDIADARDLAKKVARVRPGQTADVVIMRDGKMETVKVEIGKMPNEVATLAPSGEEAQPSPTSLGQLGLKLEPAEDGAGVKVTEVEADSPAAAKGIRAGDVILEVAGVEVNDPADIRAAMGKLKSKDKVLMLVKSGQGQRFVAVSVAKG